MSSGYEDCDLDSRNFEVVISVPAGEPLPNEKQVQEAVWKGLAKEFSYSEELVTAVEL